MVDLFGDRVEQPPRLRAKKQMTANMEIQRKKIERVRVPKMKKDRDDHEMTRRKKEEKEVLLRRRWCN